MIVIDLTQPLAAGSPIFQGDPEVTFTRVRTHADDGYQVTAVRLGSHTGTHIDAPRHFFPDGLTLDRYPADRLVRPGWVVDVRPTETPEPPEPGNVYASLSPGPAMQPPTEALPLVGTAATLAGAAAPFSASVPPHLHPAGEERVHDLPHVDTALLAARLRDVRLAQGDFLLLWTGGALLTGEAAPLLLQIGAGLVGTDAPSLDDVPFPVHRALLGAGVLIAENLANLSKLGPGRVMCAFLPLALPDADGAPMRAVAWR